MKDIQLIYRLNKNWRSNNIKIKRAGGQTNRNWIIQYRNKKFFVRLPWERAEIVDRRVEAGNILALAKCKKLTRVLPKYYLYIFKGKNILSPKGILDLPDGTMMMEYIEGRDINGKDLEKPKIQLELIKTLRTFHASGVRFVNIYDVFRDEVSKYKREANKYPTNKLIEKQKIDKIEKIEKIARKKLISGGRISTHNDLIFENLRLGKNGRIYLLDFEYAGLNVRDGLYYDLGIILGGNLFQKNPLKLAVFQEILKKIKKIYKKELDDSKIYYGALTNIIVMFWWGLVKYFSSFKQKEKRYFKDYTLKRAQGICSLYETISKNNKS